MSTYYVSTTGSDSNPGTAASPWRHFSHAAAVAAGGDTVLFADGTYDNEGKHDPNYVVTLTNSGSSGNVITFKSQNRGGAILDGGGSGGAYAYINFGNASYVVIDGFEIKNTTAEAFHNNDSAHHITVRHCLVDHIANVTATDNFGRDGIFCGPLSHDLTFDGCVWHDIGRSNTSFTTSLDHAIYAKCPNVTIINCIFYNQVCGWDIQLADGASSVLIANNVFASHNPGQNGQIMVWDSHSGITIRNNIFYNPPGFAVTHFTESVSSSFIDHNLITNSAGVYNGSGFTIGTNQLNVNPLFTNPGAFDFTLQAGSPAIDAGTTISTVASDSLGLARPAGGSYDIGAYEYQGTSTAVPAIASFASNSGTLFAGQSSTLSWTITGATSLSIDNGIGVVTGNSVSVSPSATTTYTLTATNANGSSTATATITLSANPVIDSFAANPPAIVAGSSATLSFNVAGATSLSIDNGIGAVTSGTIPVSPSATTTYTLTATNASGSSTQTATITIQGTDRPVISSFAASPTALSPGSSSTLSWTVSGADTVSINGSVQGGSSLSVSPTTTTNYTLVATNAQGSVTQTVTITVGGANAENVRYHQVRSGDRQGDGKQFQMSAPSNTALQGFPALYDATGNVIARQPRGNTTAAQLADQTGGFTPGHVLVFDAFGNAKDGGLGLTGGASGAPGSWYGQVPRGAKNGSNVTFYLDYTLASPYTILAVNGVSQKPAVDGPGSNPSPEYSISGNVVTMTHAPKTSDWFYIWYFIDQPQTIPATTGSVTITIVYDHIASPTERMFVQARADDAPTILWDPADYTGRSFTYTRDSISSGWLMQLSLQHSLVMSGTDVLKVREVYADITNPDSSVTHVVPTVSSYLGDISAFDPASQWLSVTDASGDGTHVTYSYSEATGPAVGNYVDVSGFSTAGFNVAHALVTAAGAGTFTIANSTTGSETISGSGNGLTAPDADWYGTVENTGNAVDGDPATYATVTRFHSWPGHQGGGLVFVFDF